MVVYATNDEAVSPSVSAGVAKVFDSAVVNTYADGHSYSFYGKTPYTVNTVNESSVNFFKDELLAKAAGVSGYVAAITGDGSLTLTIPASALTAAGVKTGDTVKATIDGVAFSLPVYATAASAAKGAAYLLMKPDGLFLSNGPGDPEDVTPVIGLVKALRGRLPIFGICLGHQMIALASGGATYKLKFGHRGGNHPVKNLATGKVEMTAQNHSYAVSADSLVGTGLEITHINLLDGTVEGLRCPADRMFSVQYHPESAPGPQDSAYLFDEFIESMGCTCKTKYGAKRICRDGPVLKREEVLW